MNRKQRRALKLRPDVKTIKTTNAAGITEFQEVVNLDGLIAIAAVMLAEDPDNERARTVVEWALTFAPGKPTAADFQQFASKHGITFVDTESEEYRN